VIKLSVRIKICSNCNTAQDYWYKMKNYFNKNYIVAERYRQTIII